MPTDPAVEAIDLVKHFGANRAVDGVFVVPEVSVLGLLWSERRRQDDDCADADLPERADERNSPGRRVRRRQGSCGGPAQHGPDGQSATIDELLTGGRTSA
jgi:ABC-2 type transport system ATP-binding protein